MQGAAALVSMAWLQCAASTCLELLWHLVLDITDSTARTAAAISTGQLLLSGVADAGKQLKLRPASLLACSTQHSVAGETGAVTASALLGLQAAQ
jgi:hypothetical protein